MSERVALGMVHAAPQRGEAMYDQRLFNQEQGVASGLEGDDAYNIYDKPLFADRNQRLYRCVRGRQHVAGVSWPQPRCTAVVCEQ